MAHTISLKSVNQWKESVNHYKNQPIDDITDKLRGVHQAILLTDRIVRLQQLVVACIEAQVDLEKEEADYLFEKQISSLREQALCFLRAILDTKNDDELILRMRKHAETSANDPKQIYVQNFDQVATGPDLVSMKNKHEKNKKSLEERGVIYLDKIERERFRVILSDGKFKKIEIKNRHPESSKKFNEDDNELCLTSFNSKLLKSKFEPDEAILVVDRRGNMFAGVTTLKGRLYGFHHSSLVSGKSAYFAGVIKTNSDGELIRLNNESGHYRPDEACTVKFLKHLGKRGVLSKTTKISICFGRRVFHQSKPFTKDLTDIQHEVMQESRPDSTLKSYNQWRQASNAGFFAHRYDLLKKIDNYLLQYFKFHHVNSAKENLDLLAQISASVVEQQKTHPDSKRKEAVSALASQVVKEITYWINVQENNIQAKKPKN